MAAKIIYDITVVVEQDSNRMVCEDDIKTAVCNNKFTINSMDRFIDDEWQQSASFDEDDNITMREISTDDEGKEIIIERTKEIPKDMNALNLTMH